MHLSIYLSTCAVDVCCNIRTYCVCVYLSIYLSTCAVDVCCNIPTYCVCIYLSICRRVHTPNDWHITEQQLFGGRTKNWFGRFDAEFVERRRLWLDEYLTCLLQVDVYLLSTPLSYLQHSCLLDFSSPGRYLTLIALVYTTLLSTALLST